MKRYFEKLNGLEFLELKRRGAVIVNPTTAVCCKMHHARRNTQLYESALSYLLNVRKSFTNESCS